MYATKQKCVKLMYSKAIPQNNNQQAAVGIMFEPKPLIQNGGSGCGFRIWIRIKIRIKTMMCYIEISGNMFCTSIVCLDPNVGLFSLLLLLSCSGDNLAPHFGIVVLSKSAIRWLLSPL